MAKKSKYAHLSREQIEARLEKLEKEGYGLKWEDKPEAVADLCDTQLPVLKEDKSKEIISNPHLPTNYIIEGDNYHSLFTLNFTHKKKIDVIYIDPPYNTGKKNEWKYNDHWVDENDNYRHSKWLSFMNKRLRLAKQLLKDEGVIFISIDDNEVSQLKLLCDKIFGEKNFISNIIRVTTKRVKGDKNDINKIHDYVLVYSKKGISNIKHKSKEDYSIYNLEDEFVKERGKHLIRPLDNGNISYSKKLDYIINAPDKSIIVAGSDEKKREHRLKIENLKKGWCFRWSEEKLKWGIENGFIIFKKSKGKYRAYFKIYQFVNNNLEVTEKFDNYLSLIDGFYNNQGTTELKNTIGENKFDYPKPVGLIKELTFMSTSQNSIILDFFAGSGTTAHAVMELNKEDGGNRQFILCTNNENNICTEVTYPRVKKVIEGYADKEGIPANVKYFTQTFVNQVTSDKDKRELVNRSTELLCMAENTFDVISKRTTKNDFAIFGNQEKITAIIYDENHIEECVNKLNHLNNDFPAIIYVFSYDHTYFTEDFENLKIKFIVKPIPEAILNVYRSINKKAKKR